MIAAYCSVMYLPKVTSEDVQKLDVINIAFGRIHNGLLFVPFLQRTGKVIKRLHSLKPSLRVVLSIGGWGAHGFSEMCRTPESLAAFTASCMETAEKLDLDGIDLDWEYPTHDSTGVDSPDDCKNFTTLVALLRSSLDEKFGKGKLLTAAVCGNVIRGSMEFSRIPTYLDSVSIMTYDMSDKNRVGHHTALYPTKAGSAAAVDLVEKYVEVGIPREKILIGGAFYGRGKNDVIPSKDSPLGLCICSKERKQKRKNDFGVPYDLIRKFCLDGSGKGKNGWTSGRDNGAPYLYHAKKKRFISYDDEMSVAEKVLYARRSGMAGVMYWSHSDDKSRRLLSAMYEAETQEL